MRPFYSARTVRRASLRYNQYYDFASPNTDSGMFPVPLSSLIERSIQLLRASSFSLLVLVALKKENLEEKLHLSHLNENRQSAMPQQVYERYPREYHSTALTIFIKFDVLYWFTYRSSGVQCLRLRNKRKPQGLNVSINPCLECTIHVGDVRLFFL